MEMIKVNDISLFSVHNDKPERFFLVNVNDDYYVVVDDESGYPVGYQYYEKFYSLDRATKMCDGLNDFDRKMIEHGCPGWES